MKIRNAKIFLQKIQNEKKKKEKNLNNNLTPDFIMDRKNVLDLKILIGVDVSGSISQQLYNQFMRQIDKIRGLSVIQIIEIDTQIVAMYSYTIVNKKNVVRLCGGGGTEFTPLFEKAKKMKPDALILFTDGDIANADNVKDPGFPCGLILTKGGRNPFHFGETILELDNSL